MSPVLFIPHGGGPLPLLGDVGHQAMVDFLSTITASFGQPSAILVISAHWEQSVATITSGKSPSLIYDYSGFPDEAYTVQYPAPGDPMLAEQIYGLLKKAGIEARMDDQRGFDHGLFVPLKLMYPAASIPCVQLSLVNNLDPQTHINIGKALSDLRKKNVLIIGSGLSFHNMNAFFSQREGVIDAKNRAFEDWLAETCTSSNITPQERERRLIEWADAPAARYCHPREEHLLPLHVCFGLSNSAATRVFDDNLLSIRTSAYLW